MLIILKTLLLFNQKKMKKKIRNVIQKCVGLFFCGKAKNIFKSNFYG
jgi:hypothetical protein